MAKQSMAVRFGTNISKPVTPRQATFAKVEHRLVSKFVHTRSKLK